MSDPKKSVRSVLDVPGVLRVLFQLSLATACTHEHGMPYVEDDGGTDASADWACPELADASCGDSWKYEMWGAATTFGGGIEFADFEGPGAFLGERPDGTGGTEPVVVARAWQEFSEVPGEFVIVALSAVPAEPLRAVALVSPSEIWDSTFGFNAEGPVVGYPAVALMCGDSGCSLYGVVEDAIDAAHLEAIPNGAVPIADTRGLVHFNADHSEESSDDPVCAFGDGIACFDGAAWTTVLEPGGPLLLAATLAWEDSSSPYLVASGEACRLVRQTETGFEEIPLACDADLRTVHGDSQFFAAGGDGILVLGSLEKPLECPFAGIDLALVRAESLGTDSDDFMHYWLTAFAADGRVIDIRYYDPVPATCSFAETLDGTARAWRYVSPYTDSYGSMVVTGSSAYWRGEFGGPGE